jgi:predicted patatin/cPLA2 family phospholipase
MWWIVSLFSGVLLCLGLHSRIRTPVVLQRFTSLDEFILAGHHHHMTSSKSYKAVRHIQVLSNTSTITSAHPVIQAVISRWKEGSTPGNRTDTRKIGLAIEGGGMRGCVAAGMVAAINYLGLNDAVDVVYGSSAGAMIGAYFVSRQYAGVAIYHDILPLAGRKFINKLRLLHAMGVPSLSSMKTEVLDLDFLLNDVMAAFRPLDWTTFETNERRQPLKIIASSCKDLKTVVFSKEGGHYSDRSELLRCIRASMAVPGITGDLMAISLSSELKTPFRYSVQDHRQQTRHDDILTIADAFITEPMPFRPAVDDNCSDIIVLRTRPDPAPILGKAPGLFERIIAKNYFERYSENKAVDWIYNLKHWVLYGQDLLLLNEAAKGSAQGVAVNGKNVHVLPLAPSDGSPEVNQLESNREKILVGMRDGARRVFEVFMPAMAIDATYIEAFLQDVLPAEILSHEFSIEEYETCVITQQMSHSTVGSSYKTCVNLSHSKVLSST